ncbi:hypothetical protein [Fodinicola acaciae]|uniref:hypothetical protein n=1 Tax=Fodinicola acaciae TaxID=2681555 RepID=UPI0013D1A3DC|nr:hypothetical protein [Fodinicola acaciae]
MSTGISRRGLLLGAAGLGAGLLSAAPAAAAGFDYTSRRSFDAFLAEFENSGAEGQPSDTNETGKLAWGQAYVLLALLRMYAFTKDKKYLRHFIHNADAVLDQRDCVRGVRDYRGVSGPVWRALGNYTAASTVLTDSAGTPLLQVRSAQSSVNTGASAEIVHSGGETDTSPFTLVLRPTRGVVSTIPHLNFDVASDRYVVRVVYHNVYNADTRWSVRDLRRDTSTAAGLPVAGRATLQPQPYAFAVHTGQLCRPLASFVRIVRGEPRLHNERIFREKAAHYLAAVVAAMAFHEHEYRYDPATGYGAYRWLKETPVPLDGSDVPLNQSNTLATTAAELYRATGATFFADRVVQLSAGMRASLAEKNDAYSWPYWPVYSGGYHGWQATGDLAADTSSYTQAIGAAKGAEDISHGALNVEFMLAACRTGLANTFTAADMRQLANTYTKNIVSGPTSAHFSVDGAGTAGPLYLEEVPRWIPVAEWNPDVYRHALAVTESLAFPPTFGYYVLSFAHCVIGAQRYDR